MTNKNKPRDELYIVKFCPNCGADDVYLEPVHDVLNDRKISIPTLIPPHPEHIKLITCRDCKFYFSIHYYDNLEYEETPWEDRTFVKIQQMRDKLQRESPMQNMYAIKVLDDIIKDVVEN